jgi:ribosomal-protein-alanine N-acetyltransferase
LDIEHEEGQDMLPLETERLLLRRYEDRDMADILAYSRDADFWLARNMTWEASEEGVRAYWARQRDMDPRAEPEWLDLVVELKAEQKAIGQVGIGVRKNRQGTIGWLLARKFQGRGLATEAARAVMTFGFARLGLHRIWASTGEDNVRSWRLMERLGMRREAHFRESHLVDGAWCDEFIYAMLAAAWQAR